jgi:hypothetical protein
VDQHSVEFPTRFRFSLKDDGLVAEVEENEAAAVQETGQAGALSWRTVVEMVS